MLCLVLYNQSYYSNNVYNTYIMYTLHYDISFHISVSESAGCIGCKAGYYQIDPGKTECIACPSGTFCKYVVFIVNVQ